MVLYGRGATHTRYANICLSLLYVRRVFGYPRACICMQSKIYANRLPSAISDIWSGRGHARTNVYILQILTIDYHYLNWFILILRGISRAHLLNFDSCHATVFSVHVQWTKSGAHNSGPGKQGNRFLLQWWMDSLDLTMLSGTLLYFVLYFSRRIHRILPSNYHCSNEWTPENSFSTQVQMSSVRVTRDAKLRWGQKSSCLYRLYLHIRRTQFLFINYLHFTLALIRHTPADTGIDSLIFDIILFRFEIAFGFRLNIPKFKKKMYLSNHDSTLLISLKKYQTWINCSVLNWPESTATRCSHHHQPNGMENPHEVKQILFDIRWEQECGDHGICEFMFVVWYPFGECQQKWSKMCEAKHLRNANNLNWTELWALRRLDCVRWGNCVWKFTGNEYAYSKWDMTACVRHACWPEWFRLLFRRKTQEFALAKFVCLWHGSDDGLHAAHMPLKAAASDENLS